MIPVAELMTEHLMLRPFGTSDYEYLVALHQQNAKTTFADTEDFKTDEEWKDFLNSMLSSSMTGWTVQHIGTDICFGAFYVTALIPGIVANLNPVTDIQALKDVSPTNGDGKRLRVMDEAAAEIVRYLFDTFKLQRIGGIFGANNIPAIKFCERIGMRLEGIIRRGTRVKGLAFDINVFGLLPEEI